MLVYLTLWALVTTGYWLMLYGSDVFQEGLSPHLRHTHTHTLHHGLNKDDKEKEKVVSLWRLIYYLYV